MINFKLWRVNLLNYQPISVRVPMDRELGFAHRAALEGWHYGFRTGRGLACRASILDL
jgi:hypothetical protein